MKNFNKIIKLHRIRLSFLAVKLINLFKTTKLKYVPVILLLMIFATGSVKAQIYTLTTANPGTLVPRSYQISNHSGTICGNPGFPFPDYVPPDTSIPSASYVMDKSTNTPYPSLGFVNSIIYMKLIV